MLRSGTSTPGTTVGIEGSGSETMVGTDIEGSKSVSKGSSNGTDTLGTDDTSGGSERSGGTRDSVGNAPSSNEPVTSCNGKLGVGSSDDTPVGWRSSADSSPNRLCSSASSEAAVVNQPGRTSERGSSDGSAVGSASGAETGTEASTPVPSAEAFSNGCVRMVALGGIGYGTRSVGCDVGAVSSGTPVPGLGAVPWTLGLDAVPSGTLVLCAVPLAADERTGRDEFQPSAVGFTIALGAEPDACPLGSVVCA